MMLRLTPSGESWSSEQLLLMTAAVQVKAEPDFKKRQTLRVFSLLFFQEPLQCNLSAFKPLLCVCVLHTVCSLVYLSLPHLPSEVIC